MNIKLGPPKLTDLKPRITVIGIGGAGCNAINNMIATKLDGVEFVVANTDAQSLNMSNAERRIQLGTNLTEGLGAGARPEVGEAAAREADEDIRAEIAGSHMVFIAAGMGGGTGTGAATVIAEIARDLGILTVGIVSKPFQFEGARRMRTAEAGIESLESVVDTLIVIPNQNLFRIANERTTFAEAFRLADQVLYSGIACIVDLIVKEGLINLDFADVQAVMKGMGTAMMGTGEATGEDRALKAANEAIANPLLDNITLSGAQGLLISIVGGSDLTLYEVDTAASHIRKEVAADANIIVGATTEEGMDDTIRVSIVASGLVGAEGANHPAARRNEVRPASSYGVDASSDRSTGDGTSPAVESATASFTDHDTTNDSPMPADYNPVAGVSEQPSGPINTGSHPEMSPSSITSSGEMGTDDADEFARALSEAMQEAMPATPQEDEMGAWHSADGVLIEEGFADAGASVAPPPLPASSHSQRPSASTEGFEPAPPAEVRRSVPRMPDVGDFPEMAQREYYAKMEAATDRDRSGSSSMPVQGARAKGERQPPTHRDAPADRAQAGPRLTAEARSRHDGNGGSSGGSTAQTSAPSPQVERPGLLRRLTGARK